MTDQEINIEIAEACGWKRERINSKWSGDFDQWTLGERREINPPDYLNDLNAMHDAEKVLNEKQQVWYLQKLTQVRYKDGIGGMIACMIDKTTFATARQRAEAFLRTIGKWRDG